MVLSEGFLIYIYLFFFECNGGAETHANYAEGLAFNTNKSVTSHYANICCGDFTFHF